MEVVIEDVVSEGMPVVYIEVSVLIEVDMVVEVLVFIVVTIVAPKKKKNLTKRVI